MKALLAVLTTVVAMTNAGAQGADSENARALVQAMRTDVMLLQASKEALSLATREGVYTEKQFKCFETLPASAFTADLAKILALDLTPQEVSEALAFYTSPAGSKFVEYSFVAMNRANGSSLPTTSGESGPSMSYDEMKSVRDFSRTPLGIKVLDAERSLWSPPAQAAARRIISEKLKACGAKVPQ